MSIKSRIAAVAVAALAATGSIASTTTSAEAHGPGWGIGAGLVGAAIVASAVAATTAPYPYYYGYGYRHCGWVRQFDVRPLHRLREHLLLIDASSWTPCSTRDLIHPVSHKHPPSRPPWAGHFFAGRHTAIIEADGYRISAGPRQACVWGSRTRPRPQPPTTSPTVMFGTDGVGDATPAVTTAGF
jgi:hypothetical protein